MYSKNKNAVYCFSCKLFSELKIGLTTEGVNDWKNISKRLNTHETSREHIIAYRTWKDFIKRIECGTTIDSAFLKQIDENTKLWKNIIERIISTIKLIGTQNLALRGKCDKLYEDNNGNFLKIIEYLAEFDPVMREHIKKITNNEIHKHYLGKNIQNEIINLLSTAIEKRINTIL